MMHEFNACISMSELTTAHIRLVRLEAFELLLNVSQQSTLAEFILRRLLSSLSPNMLSEFSGRCIAFTLALLLRLVLTSAQNVEIGSPANGTHVHANDTLLVEVVRPVSITCPIIHSYALTPGVL